MSYFFYSLRLKHCEIVYNTNMKILNYEQIDEVVSIINQGGIVAFPTDTVYGLGCRYDLIEGIEAIKKAKGRDEKKPLPMMTYDINSINEVAKVNEKSKILMQAFMPGAFTIILPKNEIVPPYVTNGFDTIGIRIPDDKFIIDMIKAVGKPLLVTSANKSDTPSLVNAQDVIATIGEHIDAIVIGDCKGSQASTIVSMVDDDYKIIREYCSIYGG